MEHNDEPETDSGERGYTRYLKRVTVRAEVMVGAGAIAGVIGRYAVGRWTSQHLLWTFPVGTFAVNIVGCFLIGLIQYLFVDAKILPRPAQLLLAVGFCGGLTTFSTFSVETLRLLQSGHAPVALLYQVLSFAFGLLAVVAGMGVGKAVHMRRVAP